LVCGTALDEVRPYPVCGSCIVAPVPLAPEIFCARCGAAFLSVHSLDAAGFCRLCAAGATAFATCYSFGEYEGALRDLIHLFKYQRIRPLAEPLGRMLARALPPQARYDALVPMPLHWRRRFVRGFNQAELLAHVVSRRTGLPVLEALRRRRHSPAQASLASASQRRANVRGVFALQYPSAIAGKRLLLVDDVLTSGATVNSAAAVLAASGADRVSVLTLARADRRKPALEFKTVVESIALGDSA
jgi:ComF family protein